MTIINIIGVDPGPTTGIAILHWSPAARDGDKPGVIWRGYQCDADSASGLLVMMLNLEDVWHAGEVEHFVHGNLPNSPATVRLENELADVALACEVRLARRPMAAVKPWATDKRMTASGAWTAIPAKMVDARAAARHALFCAVHDGKLPDPLSRKGKVTA
jgi:hypothetical protein